MGHRKRSRLFFLLNFLFWFLLNFGMQTITQNFFYSIRIELPFVCAKQSNQMNCNWDFWEAMTVTFDLITYLFTFKMHGLQQRAATTPVFGNNHKQRLAINSNGHFFFFNEIKLNDFYSNLLQTKISVGCDSLFSRNFCGFFFKSVLNMRDMFRVYF